MSGLEPLLHDLFRPLSMVEQFQHTPALIWGVLDFCLASAFLAFSRAAPDFRVFRMTGAYYLLIALEQLWIYHGGEGSDWVPRTLAIYLLVEMAAEAMEIRHRRWTLVLVPVYAITLVLGWFPQFAYMQQWPLPSSAAVLAILIVQGFLHGRRRDRLIAGAFTIHWFVRLTAMSVVQRTLGLKPYFSVGAWNWAYASISQTLLGVLTLVVFVRALVEDRTERQRMLGELEAARAVQQVLIPESIPSTPGFEINAAYRPFGEVGGDFFQILPQVDGSVLVAIGDVSGKGTSAAMIVSLVVGALHSLAEVTNRPGELLAGLNRRVMGRSGGGFTTCLLFCAEQGGQVTFANAGHLSPYLEGREIVLKNGFPLGLVVDCVYEETALTLDAGATLTLLTDGVVEARDRKGELFGFERTERISSGPAETIVEAAQVFGQDDDITALTVKRLEWA
jgi:hypothetical protein